MKVLVSDSSILIEFSKRELLDRMFQLEFEFAVPDLLFHEELIDLGTYSRHDLLNQYQGGMCISGVLPTTERTPRQLISPLGPNWVGTGSAV